MAISPAGKKKLAAQVFLFVVNIVVLALAAQVNRFQDFFFVADLFPLGLSIATLVILVFLLTIDFSLENAYTARAHMEIGIFGVLSVFWLGFNAFSTSRWRQIPFQCNSIPVDLSGERNWCKNVQALKGFIWVEFLTCLIITMATFRYAATQYSRGNKHIWKISLSRYRPEVKGNFGAGIGSDRAPVRYPRFD